MKKWILVGILVLGAVLRLIALDKYPSGFTPDEASFGYDAYSILRTGKDQWGNAFPLVLKSFGDYKAPLYSYLDIPFVAILGLNKIAVRLPNAVLGTLAIVVTYLLVRKIAGYKLSLIAAFLIAISPWHIMMSRGGFEANLTTFFLPLGIYLLLDKKLVLAALALGLNLFTYHSAKLVTPLVLMIFIVIFRDEIFKIDRKKILAGGLVFFVFLAVTGYTIFNGAGARVKDVSIFNGSLEEGFNERQVALAVGENSYLAKLIHNKYTVDIRKFVSNYVTYFSPSFLFTHGPAEYTYGMLAGEGVLYWFELPLLVLFFISFVKSRERKFFWLILGWILVAPIPASLATGLGYAGNRVVIILPALSIALALGLVEGWKFLKNKYLAGVFIVFCLLCFLGFLENYFVVSPAVAAKGMLYGNLEAANWLAQDVGKNTNIVLDKGISEPHIYVAFANKWDPAEYQGQTKKWDFEARGLKWVDQLPEYSLGNYIFKTVRLEQYLQSRNTLLVARPDIFPSEKLKFKSINYPDGKTALDFVMIDGHEK